MPQPASLVQFRINTCDPDRHLFEISCSDLQALVKDDCLLAKDDSSVGKKVVKSDPHVREKTDPVTKYPNCIICPRRFLSRMH